LAREEALRPFDLGRGPLLRATLLRLAEPRHLLLLTLHHIVADGWSMGILVRELGELYGAAAAGRPAVLPELPISYADFAVWQREWLAGGALAEPLAWWREHLAGAPAVLDLPLDRPRPPVPSFRGAHLPVRLPADLSRALAVYGRTRGATPFMVLSAAFAALLSRLSGAEDLVVGSPVANRERPEVSGLIGFFVNTLALRHDLSGDPAFAGFLDRVRTGTMAALAHQDVPFERLVEELAPERDLRHTPLFQVFFALQNAPVGPLALPGLALEPLLLSNGRAKFDLSLALAEAVDGLAGSFEYATDLFDAATVERLAARFERLLAGALERPETRLSELPLLSAEEREQLVVDWAARVSDYPREATLDGLFAEVAAHRPDAVALVDGERQLSYGALAARAGHLAGRLRALGVAPEVRVGLLLPRSLEMVVATLAVLRAGGVYVPLDPTHPEERLAFLLSDTGAPVVVTIASLRATLPALETAVLCLDREAGREPGSAAFASRTVAESLAYVMYTSGSTGVPKGVAVRHRGVVRLVRDSDYARLGREDVVALVSNTAFDAATFEIWGALLNGGRLVVIEPAAVLPPAVFAARLAREGVTLLSLTIALFNRMVWEAPEALRNLRSLYFGGEAADAEAVARLVALGPPERLIHLYGPTEITCFATWYRVPGVPGAPGAPALPIGRPLANTAVYLLGRHLEPVAAGAPGEIWLGGDGLARGYLDRPDRTAERFVPAPFGAAGERLYRTGDRARFRPNGEIEFLGRLDAQVKIRGFRIEPGEVEAALLRQSGVTAAVVVVREEGGEKRLAAYYVGAPEPAELRAALRRALPEYLVPAALVPLPELLLNPNGKIDRRALPVPPELGEGTAGEAPRTAVEARLAAIWCELLGRTRVGRSEDFFALGGHSLLATRLLSRLQTAFGVELPLLQLFESPTLSEQAARVAAAVAGSVAPIPRSGRRKDLPLSFAQERLWFLDRLEPGAPTYNVATAVRLQGALDRPALDRSLGEIVRRHEVLRTTFGLVAGRPAQRVGPATGFALPRVDLASLASETREGEARRLTAEEAARPFDLARGPLLRGILVGLAPGEHLALLTFHHIVFDGWSGEVVVRELGALYPANIGGGGGAGGGQPSPLPELPIQYADFALWQRAQLAGERLAGELAYWREALAGLPALALTTDRVRPPVRNSRSAIHLVRWPEAFVRAAAGLAQARGATLFMALLAGFVALLHRYTGQEDFALG
ncbi:MAG TPA: amino acid adenylation domain-containing protein, partial [Thermoanaerobaculia bacterium]|nr:amino acid adenylation domain-containing protein [Thermoanaerobaculia bacterium]